MGLLPLLLLAISTPSGPETFRSSEGALALRLGVQSAPLEGELGGAARAWANRERGALGLAGPATLGEPALFGTRFGVSVRMPVELGGVPVYGAQVVVTLDPQRRVTQLSSSVRPFARAELTWKVGAARALALASRAVPLPLLQPSGAPYGGVRRQLFHVGPLLRAGYLTYVPTVDRARNWFVAIDAGTGQVLWKEDRVYRAAQTANAYPSSPGGLDAGVGAVATATVQLTHADGGAYQVPNDGGRLVGDQLTAFGCCPSAGCDAGAPAKRATGNTTVGALNVVYDVVECDRVQRASNDPAIHGTGDFVYPPQDPPALTGGQPGPVAQAEPADSDPFAEVHAFYHVNRVFDFVRGLSRAAVPLFPGQTIPPFTMRDERRLPPKTPVVWANVTLPDFEDLIAHYNPFTGAASTNKLAREDNAAFLVRENFEMIVLPDYMIDADVLYIFQGDRADFSYDAPILWHEFGHGMVYATAGLEAFALDARSGNDEGGAMHEGVADFLAAIFGQSPNVGVYVGPRISGGVGSGVQLKQDVALRSLANNLACPDVLWGETHQDSRHFSAALWEGRRDLFQGADQGRTFDAAFYAALVSMSPATDFAQAAAIFSAHAQTAFPGVANAAAKLNAIFARRGVTGCSKVVEVTAASAPRPMYGIGGRDRAGLPTSTIPGPVQLKLKVPSGARAVHVSAQHPSSLLGGSPTLRLLAKANAPITFTRTGGALDNDADREVPVTVSGSVVGATAVLEVPCGVDSAVFVSLGNAAGADTAVRDLEVSVDPALSCDPPAPIVLPLAEAAGAPAGCGCGATGPGAAALLAGMLALQRVRRRTR